jgi:PAS domain S-box-containing protein
MSENLAAERDPRLPSGSGAVAASDRALRESEQRFRQIAEAINHVFWVLELRPLRHVSYVSPAFERIWGRRAEEFLDDAMLWTRCLHPDDRPATAQAFELWLQDPRLRSHAVEYRIVRPDGELRWISDRGQVVLDDAGGVYRVTGVAEDITERKLAEEQARSVQEQFRLLAETLPQLVWARDASGAASYLSPQWAAYAGVPAGDLLGHGWRAHVHPDDRERVGAQWRGAVERQGEFDCEYRVRRADGVYRWFRSRGAPQRDANGQIVRWFGTCTDIDEARLATAALQEERDRIARIADVAPAILHSFRIGPDGRRSFPFGAERLAELYGVPADGLATDGRPATDRVHPEDGWLRARIDESRRTMMPLRAEYRVLHAGRGEVWIGVHSQPSLEPDGGVVWQGTLTDITARKQSEQALEQSEAQFEAVFANLAEGILVFRPDGTMTHSNPAAAEMYDLVAPEAPASLQGFIATFELRDERGHLIPVRDWPLSRILRGETLSDLEAWVRHLDRGWTKAFSYAGSLVRDAQGQARFGIVRMRDVTASKQAQVEIHALNTRLEQRVTERTAELEAAVKELEAFTYTVSHDLRAPLRALDGFSQAVLQDFSVQVPETGQRYLKIIRESAQKMGQLIDDLLAFSRVGRQQPRMLAVDNMLLVRNALQQLAPMREGRQVEVRVAALPPAEGDPAMLHQVWINLLSNALKYSRTTAAAVIEVGALIEPGGPVYFVRDNGVGFDMRYAHKLFGVFERLHRAEEFEGTGVGLAIVQRIVQRHGGSVRTEAAPGRGATFFFQLGQVQGSAS